MKCMTKDLWFATFLCENCEYTKQVAFTCKRWFCSSCSKPLADKFTNNLTSRLPLGINYIHITFTLPEELRDLRLQYRHLWILSFIFQVSSQVIISYFKKQFGITPGIFSMIHTFGSYVNRNPHIHMVCTLWWLLSHTSGEYERISLKWRYLSYRSVKSKRRAELCKKLRSFLKANDYENYHKWSAIISDTFKKSRYVKLSDPIIKPVKVTQYITRYMYRAPVSLCKIMNHHFVSCPHKSTIILEYEHKKPREKRTITYSIFKFLWLILRQLPDKYFRRVRFYWLFASCHRKKYLTIINTLIPPTKEFIPQKPHSYAERMYQSFGNHPLLCPSCRYHLTLHSITYFSKRSNSFITKHFDPE